MDDNKNMENNNTGAVEAAAGKTFTQDEVNRIISERLNRERDKRTSELDEREKAVASRELAVMAREKLEAAGLNKELCKVLKYDSEKELDEAISQLQNIKGFSDPEKKLASAEKHFIENKLPASPENHDLPDTAFRKAFGLRA